MYKLLALNTTTGKHGQTPPIFARKDISIDEKATWAGDAYRGAGVFVGLAGATIIFCAITPVALELRPDIALIFGIAEISLMVLIVLVLFFCQGLKGRWIEFRALAESARYAPLRTDRSDSNQLRAYLDELLGGKDCQIKYNELKRDQYHHMEEAAKIASVAGFGISMVAALLHLVLHASWLLFFTAFLPALVGALHGINSFLQLGQLHEDHGEIAVELKTLRDRLEFAKFKNDSELLQQVAEEAYQLLTSGHKRWRGVAERVEVKAP